MGFVWRKVAEPPTGEKPGADRECWRSAGSPSSLWLPAAGLAQEIPANDGTALKEKGPGPADTEPVAYGEIQALIEDMQSRISNIDAINQDAGTALDALDDQVDKAIDKLSSRQDENVGLRDRASGLTSELDSLAVTHLELSAAVARAEDERSSTEERLQREINALAEQLALERGETEALRTNLSDVGILLDEATAKREPSAS